MCVAPLVPRCALLHVWNAQGISADSPPSCVYVAGSLTESCYVTRSGPGFSACKVEDMKGQRQDRDHACRACCPALGQPQCPKVCGWTGLVAVAPWIPMIQAFSRLMQARVFDLAPAMGHPALTFASAGVVLGCSSSVPIGLPLKSSNYAGGFVPSHSITVRDVCCLSCLSAGSPPSNYRVWSCKNWSNMHTCKASLIETGYFHHVHRMTLPRCAFSVLA